MLRRDPRDLRPACGRHRAALARLREQGRTEVDEDDLFRVGAQLRAITDTAARTTRKTRRGAELRSTTTLDRGPGHAWEPPRPACGSPGDRPPRARYPGFMAPNGTSDTRDDTTAMLAAVGIEITDEGKARARERLNASSRQRTQQLREQWREQLGLPAAKAA